jgi:hypothetical protein
MNDILLKDSADSYTNYVRIRNVPDFVSVSI